MSISDDEIRQAISETFRVEADEHIQSINRLLLKLEQGGVDDLAACLDEIAREAHTLKGASSILGLTLIQDTSHAMEEVFEALRDARREAPVELFDLLYDALDRLAEGCHRVEDPTGEDAAALEKVRDACLKYAESASQKSSPAATVANATSIESPEERSVVEPSIDTEIGGPAAVELGIVEEDVEIAVAPEPDVVHALVERAAPEPEPVPEERFVESDKQTVAEETIRVPIRKLDSLMAQIGELLIAKIRNEDRMQALKDLHIELEDANKDWGRLKEVRRALASADPRRARSLDTKRRDLLERMEGHLKNVNSRVSSLMQNFNRDAMHTSILTENLQEDIKKARMLPVSTILGGFQRLVRDVARRENKIAVLELVGTETEVDKRVLEMLKDPLMHTLRNAVSHGIEPPDQREAAGKPRAGTIRVVTRQIGGQIQILVEDDGRGIDVDAVLDRALKMGLTDSAIARTLTDREILQFIFHSGLSTKSSITDVSGRGVGMDVVRENIHKVQGQIALDTTRGRGSRITITLPLTLSTTKSLLVRAGTQTFAIPINCVERIVRVTADEIEMIEDTPALILAGAPVAVARLAEVLGLGGDDGDDDAKFPVVILSAGERRLGLIIDSLVDEREIVVKPLGKQLLRVRNIAGGTIVGSGDVLLVLDPLDIVNNAAPGPRAASGAVAAAGLPVRGHGARNRILVVEDSITTRTLEKNILETAGYDVVACKDGYEALRYLQTNTCDALITDINMPNMNGFQLVEQVRRLDAHRELPILLVTSLGSDEDRMRGMQVGADGYIVKRDFEQGRFLHMLEALL